MEWKCLICEKPVEVLSEEDDSKGYLPNIVGGTIAIDFGYGSSFDDANIHGYEYIKHESCICDNCYKKKMHLTRSVVLHESQYKEILPETYRDE